MKSKDAIPPEDEFEFAEELAEPAPTSITGASSSEHLPEDRQALWWLENVYRGDKVRQISIRAIVTGMLIGGVMSISNLYVGLKTGWGLGVTITACIIAYAVFSALEAIVPAYRNRPFTILENLTMSSAASAAGYISSAGLVSSIRALSRHGPRATWWEMMLWLGAVAPLGVCMAILLKRQLINIDQLPFPSGIATAETLKGIHSAGSEAMQKAKALLWAAVAGGVVKLWKDALPPAAAWLGGFLHRPAWGQLIGKCAFPETFPLFPGGQGWLERLTIGFEGSTIMVAAGAIMGIRVGVSLLIGAVVYYGVIGSVLIEKGIVIHGGYKEIVQWTLWPSTAMMVTSGLLAFGMRWRTVLRAFSELAPFRPQERPQGPALTSKSPPGGSCSGSAYPARRAWCSAIGDLGSRWMGILAVF